MRCDQIEPYASDYAGGSLPGYKAAWVAQHLAGCESCRALVESARLAPAPAEPDWAPARAARPAHPVEAEASYAVLRPAPGWVRPAVALLGAVIVASALWAILWSMTHPPVRRSEASGREPAGMSAIGLPPDRKRFTFRYSGVNQAPNQGWNLPLPPPPARLEHPGRPLKGVPAETTLVHYGTVGEMLHVVVRSSAPGVDTIPRLFLRDASGVLFAPTYQSRTVGASEVETMLHYPLPKQLRLPITLVGEGHLRQYLGHWTIDLNVVK